jgi:5'-3' exonuclease
MATMHINRNNRGVAGIKPKKPLHLLQKVGSIDDVYG